MGIVLLYHNVPDKYVDRFRKQLSIIQKYSNPVPAGAAKKSSSNERSVAITFDDGHRNVLKNVYPEIIKNEIPITLFIPSAYLGSRPEWFSSDRYYDEGTIVMNAKELKEINQSPLVTIGSHSKTHPRLTGLDEADIKKEIIQSKKDLELILHESIFLLSFPHGEYNDYIVSLCEQAGYAYVFTILPVSVTFDKNEYVRGRIDVDPWDWTLEFYLKLIGAYLWLPIAFNLKSRILRFLGIQRSR